MSRISIPTSIDALPAASQPLLQAVKKQLGAVPNLFRVVGHSAAALEGYLSLKDALGKGALGAATAERIALAVAQIDGCGYCLSAHSYLGKHVAKLDEAEMTRNRDGRSNDVKADAALRFAVKVTELRGHVGDDDLRAIRDAGYNDAEIVEIVVHVALNTLTNYINEVAQTEIDFPKVGLREAA